MVLTTITRNLRFHLKIMKTFPKEVGQTATQDLCQGVVKTGGNVFVAWHPDQDFPYECSKPINLNTKSNASLLKKNVIANANEAFQYKDREMVIRELKAATYTTKHIWYPRGRDKRAKKTPMDRPYL